MHISSIIRLLSSSQLHFCFDRIQFSFACRHKMIKVFCFILFTLLIFVRTKGFTNVAKVVGGDIAPINAFPYQAALISMKKSGFSICCGSVISSKAVLTGELMVKNITIIMIIHFFKKPATAYSTRHQRWFFSVLTVWTKTLKRLKNSSWSQQIIGFIVSLTEQLWHLTLRLSFCHRKLHFPNRFSQLNFPADICSQRDFPANSQR